VTTQKRAEQMANGAAMAERFGIKEPKEAFIRTQETYGCANWVCEDTAKGFTATCTSCMLVGMSKKMGNYSPCRIFCLSPIEASIHAVAPGAEFITEKTMWDGDKCVVNVTYK
jgi:hypothetical protein